MGCGVSAGRAWQSITQHREQAAQEQGRMCLLPSSFPSLHTGERAQDPTRGPDPHCRHYAILHWDPSRTPSDASCRQQLPRLSAYGCPSDPLTAVHHARGWISISDPGLLHWLIAVCLSRLWSSLQMLCMLLKAVCLIPTTEYRSLTLPVTPLAINAAVLW